MAHRPLSSRWLSNISQPLKRNRTYICHRCLSTATAQNASTSSHLPPPIPYQSSLLPQRRLRSPYKITHHLPDRRSPNIKVHPPPPSAATKHKFPLLDHNAAQIAALDPRGVRTRLFDRKNPDAPQPGDILMVTFKTGEPFAGICLSIKRRGVDTAILLRNKLMLTGVEVWAKIYSPNVRSIEIVKRAVKRARRARLYYKRLPKHDLSGSGLESEVENYLRTRRLIRSGASTRGTQQTGAAGGVERK